LAVIMFVGVTTGSSLIHRAMTSWNPLLGASCDLRGVDIPVGADDDCYRRLLDEVTSDDSVAGAVITTHKLRVFETCRTRFASLEPRRSRATRSPGKRRRQRPCRQRAMG
jgi:shikimate dehydrogenase